MIDIMIDIDNSLFMVLLLAFIRSRLLRINHHNVLPRSCPCLRYMIGQGLIIEEETTTTEWTQTVMSFALPRHHALAIASGTP